MKPTKQPSHPPRELPQHTLYLLLLALLTVWLICYLAERDAVAASIERDLIARVNLYNVSKGDYEAAVRGEQEQKEEKEGEREGDKGGSGSGGLCIVVRHWPNNQNWYGPMLSLLSQHPSLPSLTIHYLNNQRGSKEIESYLSSNAIHSSSILFLPEEIPSLTYRTFLETVKNKCKGHLYVMLAEDVMAVAGGNVGRRAVRVLEGGMEVVYGGVVVVDRVGGEVGVGQAFPYPEEVIREGKFVNYPLVMNGPIFLTYSLFSKLACKYCWVYTDKTPNPKLALYIELLQKAQGKIQFLNEPLSIVQKEFHQKFITDPQIKKHLKQFQTVNAAPTPVPVPAPVPEK